MFVAGHPGRTDRLNTVAHLEFMRDRTFPTALNLIRRREVLLNTYSERSLENTRRAKDELFGYKNSRKARLGGLAGLQDPAIHAPQERERTYAAASRRGRSKAPRSCRRLGRSAGDSRAPGKGLSCPSTATNKRAAFNSELFGKARTLVRLVEETSKPNAERLREYRQSNLESLEQELFSEAPIYDDLEIIKLTDSLGMLVEMAGAEDPLVRTVLDGNSPARASRSNSSPGRSSRTSTSANDWPRLVRRAWPFPTIR